MDMKISAASALQGIIDVPGDKSISHRALFLGAIAEGTTRVTNFLPAQDCLSTLHCLEMLGARIRRQSTDDLEIKGVGFRGFKEPPNVLDAGNSGTTLRILPGILAAQNFFSVMTGDESLRSRPMKRILTPLTMMGANIWARDGGNLAPIAIQGGPLEAISYTTEVPSAQLKTALLLAGLFAAGTTEITEEFQSRDHTERMLEFLGAPIETEKTTYRISSISGLQANDINIPGDISSAAFFLVAASIAANSEITIRNVGTNPTRTGILDVLNSMGVKIRQIDSAEICREPRADLVVMSSPLKPFNITKDIIPLVIDELPILALAATQAEGTTIVSGAQELRIKESDRITSTCAELNKLGANISERPDGFVVNGPTKLNGAVVDSHGDHRLAMTLSIAGLVARGTTTVRNADCIQVSFPQFYKTLEKLVS